MKKHTRIAMKSRGYTIADIIICEVCMSEPAVDCHHIDPRKMGSLENKDIPENLIFCCRSCHIKAERYELSKEFLFMLVQSKLSKC
jgi:hypothetical protein